MTYMTNPYPYMDRVADLVSEAVAMTTGEVTGRTGKEKLDMKIEGKCHLSLKIQVYSDL